MVLFLTFLSSLCFFVEKIDLITLYICYLVIYNSLFKLFIFFLNKFSKLIKKIENKGI